MKQKFMGLGIAAILTLTVLMASGAVAAKKQKYPLATVKTNKGTFVMELHPEEAPIAVANFIKLANKKFYDGVIFHRYEPGILVQGGDPDGTGRGGPGWTIKDEVNKKMSHDEGAVGMAKTSLPNSAGSQFYICLRPLHSLDGNYIVFAKVIEGMDNVKKLRVGDKMESVRITEPASGHKKAK
jgi:peptidyl-prolyl cis-trans isomerase B (cyclophilin B)